MSFPIIFAFVLLGLGGLQAQSQYTSCSSLPTVEIDYSLAAKYSPLLVMRSTQPGYNCSTGFLTGPAPLESQNYTFIVVQNQTIKNTFQVYPNYVGNATQLTMCDQMPGTELIYRFLPYTMTATTCFFVTYICNTTDDSLFLVRAYGHTASDESLIANTISQYNLANIPGGQNIQSTWDGCQFSDFCNDLFM